MAEPLPAPAPEPDTDPLIGRVIDGRYRIVGTLGVGGMGRVYRAIQEPLGRSVALKVLATHQLEASDPQFQKRFFLEASVTAKLTHPNTVTLFDYGRTADGIFFIAMEHLAGRTLARVMREEGPLAPARAVHIAMQICRSLREAHKQGVIHRDLKPANVMLLDQPDDPDFVKVLDFGLVKFFSGEQPEGDITSTGTFMGSPHYVAPEQARNANPDQRVDVYSLGVLLYHMLTGKVPFTAASPVDIIVKHLHEAPLPPRQLRPELPRELEFLILKALAKDRQFRWQSMDELLGALREVGKLVGLDPTGQHASPSGAGVVPTGPQHFPPPVPELPTALEDVLRANPPELPEDVTSGAIVWSMPQQSSRALVTAGVLIALVAVAVSLVLLRRPQPKTPVVVAPPTPRALDAPPRAPSPSPSQIAPPAPAPQADVRVEPPAAPAAAPPAAAPAPPPSKTEPTPAKKSAKPPKKPAPHGYKDDPYE